MAPNSETLQMHERVDKTATLFAATTDMHTKALRVWPGLEQIDRGSRARSNGTFERLWMTGLSAYQTMVLAVVAHKAETYLTSPSSLNDGCTGISFPSSSFCFEIRKTDRIEAIVMNNKLSASCLPGHILRQHNE